MFRWPWVRRAEIEREQRLSAEQRCEDIQDDWIKLRKFKHSIDQEIELNDWTETAIVVFSGKNR